MEAEHITGRFQIAFILATALHRTTAEEHTMARCTIAKSRITRHRNMAVAYTAQPFIAASSQETGPLHTMAVALIQGRSMNVSSQITQHPLMVEV